VSTIGLKGRNNFGESGHMQVKVNLDSATSLSLTNFNNINYSKRVELYDF
jgi:hypothetical protein